MSRRNKNTTLNLNLSEQEMRDIIASVLMARDDAWTTSEEVGRLEKVSQKLKGTLNRFIERRSTRNAERKAESGTPEGETSQSPGVLQMRSEGISHNADGNRPVPEVHGEGNSQQ